MKNTVLCSNELFVKDKDLELVLAYLKACTLHFLKDMSCLRGLIAGLSLQSAVFRLRLTYVGFVANKMVLGHVFLPALPLSNVSTIPTTFNPNSSVTGNT